MLNMRWWHLLKEKGKILIIVTQCAWWYLQVKAHANSICSHQYVAGVIRVIELLGLWQLGACKSHNNRAWSPSHSLGLIYRSKSSNNGWWNNYAQQKFLLFLDFLWCFWTKVEFKLKPMNRLFPHMTTSYFNKHADASWMEIQIHRRGRIFFFILIFAANL